MTLQISPYLVPYVKTADQLPDLLPDIPEAVVQDLQARILTLVELVAARDEEIRKLERRTDHQFQPSDKYCGLPERKHSISQLLVGDRNPPAVEPPRDEVTK